MTSKMSICTTLLGSLEHLSDGLVVQVRHTPIETMRQSILFLEKSVEAVETLARIALGNRENFWEKELRDLGGFEYDQDTTLDRVRHNLRILNLLYPAPVSAGNLRTQLAVER